MRAEEGAVAGALFFMVKYVIVWMLWPLKGKE